MSTSAAPAPGGRITRVGPYKLGKTLGIGSFSKVKLATHELMQQKVAIKILNRKKLKKQDMGEKVRTEIHILRLFTHPHIIRLYEVIDTPSDIFTVMEYVPGGELFDYIVSRGKLEEAEARALFQQIISGIHYCVAAGTRVALANQTSVRIEFIDSESATSVLSYSSLSNVCVPQSTEPPYLLNQGTRHCVELMLEDGRRLVCTPDHTVVTTRGECQVQHLLPDDRILVGAEGPLVETPQGDDSRWIFSYTLQDEDIDKTVLCSMAIPADYPRIMAFSRLLGYMSTDGIIQASNHDGCVYMKHLRDVKTIMNDMQLILGGSINIHYTEPDEHSHSYQVSVPSQLCTALSEYGVPIGENLRQPVLVIPSIMLKPETPRAFVREFLGGMFGSGGDAPSISHTATGNDESSGWTPVTLCVSVADAEFGSASKRIQNELVYLLNGFGVKASVSFGGRCSDLTTSVSHQIRFEINGDSIGLFHDTIGFRHCVDKQQRLSIAAGWYRGVSARREQNRRLRAQMIKYQDLGLDENSAVRIAAAQMEASEVMFCACTTKQHGSTKITDEGTNLYKSIKTYLTETGADQAFIAGCARDCAALPVWHLGIVGSRDVGLLPTYDISVANTHLFLANGLVVHNCHVHGVVHRDLKPENLLLDADNKIKLADFGLSNRLKDGQFLKTSCGSPNYAAPEVISGSLYAGPEVDVWSCGVILFALLCGSLPFDDENIRALFRKIKGGHYTIPPHVSPLAKDLISRMLQVDPLQRIKVSEIMKHTWYMTNLPAYLALSAEQQIERTQAIDEEVLQKVIAHGYNREKVLKALAMGHELLTSRKLAHHAELKKIAVIYNLFRDQKRRKDQQKDEIIKDLQASFQPPKDANSSSSGPDPPLDFSTMSHAAATTFRHMAELTQQINMTHRNNNTHNNSNNSNNNNNNNNSNNNTGGSMTLSSQQVNISSLPTPSANLFLSLSSSSNVNHWQLGVWSRDDPLRLMNTIYTLLRKYNFEWKVLSLYKLKARHPVGLVDRHGRPVSGSEVCKIGIQLYRSPQQQQQQQQQQSQQPSPRLEAAPSSARQSSNYNRSDHPPTVSSPSNSSSGGNSAPALHQLDVHKLYGQMFLFLDLSTNLLTELAQHVQTW